MAASMSNTMGIGVILSFFTMGVGAIVGVSHTLKRMREGMMATNVATKLFYRSIMQMVAGLALMKIGMAGVKFVFGGKDEFASLQTEILHVRAILNDMDLDMTQFMNRARQLGATYGESSAEIAEGMKVLARAGFSATETLAMIEPVTQAAIIGEMGLEEAAHSVIAAFRSFNMTATESQHLVDMLARGTTLYRLEMDDYAQAVGRFGASAQAANQDLASMIAILGTLTTRGLSASRSGTMLKMMLNKLRAPSASAAATMERMGLVVYQADGNMRPILDIMRDIETSFRDMGAASGDVDRFYTSLLSGTEDAAAASMQEAQILRTLFGQRALVGFDVQTQGAAEFNGQLLEGINLIEAQAEEIRSSEGFATQYAETVMVSWERIDARIREAWAMIRGTITEQIWPIIKPLLDKVISTLQVIKAWMDKNPIAVKIFAVTAIIMGGLATLAGFGVALMGIIALLGTIIAKFKLIIAKEIFLSVIRFGKIAAFIAVILLVIALVFIFKDTVDSVAKWVANAFADAIAWVVDGLVWLGTTIGNFFASIFNTVVDWIKQAISDVFGFIGSMIDTLIPDWISGVGKDWGAFGLNEGNTDAYAAGAYSVPRTGLAIVHEREEIVADGDNEYQKDKTMSMGGGEVAGRSVNIGTVNIQTTATGDVKVDAEAIFDQLMAKMKEEVEREFTEAQGAGALI